MSVGAWFADRNDRRTRAALARSCPVPTCLAVAGDDCKNSAGIVHSIRVPEKVLYEQQ